MSVCWGPGRSKSFGVSNGVCQGGVLSPLLFSVSWIVLLRICLSLVLVVIGVIILLEPLLCR